MIQNGRENNEKTKREREITPVLRRRGWGEENMLKKGGEKTPPHPHPPQPVDLLIHRHLSLILDLSHLFTRLLLATKYRH
jgi:hypothetical protein